MSSIRISGWPSDMRTLGVLLRMIVPGWAQRYAGRAGRGKLFFCCFLGLLLAGLLFLGTPLGWICLGLALSIHAASILDIVAASIVDFRQRLLYSAVAMLLLLIVVYYPAGWLLSLVASPQYFNMAAPPFQAGDVVLVNPSAFRWSDPKPGEVVIYGLPENDVFMPGRLYRFQGDRIDRILAGPGQRVAFDQGKLLIDDKPSQWLSLSTVQLPDKLDITVPQGCYFIASGVDALPQTAWQAASIVPRRNIWGRAYWRSQPLWRFGPIR